MFVNSNYTYISNKICVYKHEYVRTPALHVQCVIKHTVNAKVLFYIYICAVLKTKPKNKTKSINQKKNEEKEAFVQVKEDASKRHRTTTIQL